MKPTVLFLFNSSSHAVQPWLDDGGFNVVSVDYDDTDHSGAHRAAGEGHRVMNIDLARPDARFEVGQGLRYAGLEQPSLVVSFAPCTDLAVSGAAHFARKREANPQFQQDAVRMARLAEQFGCPYMVENPVSVLSSMWRKPEMYWHPYDFAYLCPAGPHPEFPDVLPPRDLYPKKTGLWAGNGFKLPLKADVPKGLPVPKVFPGHAKLGGKSARTKYIRSLTPRGFAQAVYEANRDNILSQWGTQVAKECGTIQYQLEMSI